MLLRVDYITGGSKPDDPKPSSLSTVPLHACLATAAPPCTTTTRHVTRSVSADSNPSFSTSAADVSPGEIITIGRKNSHVTLDDKCVSRGHASIRLVSKKYGNGGNFGDENGNNSTTISLQLPDDDNGRITMQFAAPSTSEERRLCDSSTNGVIAVLVDKGSKFGTFVSVDEDLEREFQQQHSKDSGSHDDDDGDETADETDAGGGENNALTAQYAELSDKQTRAVKLLSGSASSDSGSGTTKFRRLQAKQSIPLLGISHERKSKSSSNYSKSKSNSSPHVIVLFGPQGSGVRLSLLPLQFTFSRVSTEVQSSLISTLPYIGATHSTQWDVHKSTHLVTSELKATAKHIMAWACRRPTVTIHYIHALLSRTSPHQPLPDESDFNPPGETQLDQLPTVNGPCIALTGYQIAVLVENDDSGPLALSAGAEMLDVAREAPENEEEFGIWWKERKKLASGKMLVLVAVHNSSRKCAHLRQWLEKLQKVGSGEHLVRFTNPKYLAKAITVNGGKGEMLKDVNGKFIEKLCSDERNGFLATVAAGDDEGNLYGEPELMTDLQKDAQSKQRNDDVNKEAPQQHSHGEEPVEETTFDAGNDHVDNTADENDFGDGDVKATSKNKSRKRRQEETKEVESKDEADDSGAARLKRRRQDNVANEQTHSGNRQRQIRVETPDDERPTERTPLPITEDGWFVAAPSKRTAYRSSTKEIEELMGDEGFRESAQTAIVSGLVVREYVSPNEISHVSAPAGRFNLTEHSNKKKDFKRFRKNAVMRGYSTFVPTYASGSQRRHLQIAAPSIRLVSVLPKDSERQRQLEIQQLELERDQEAADLLFNDGGGGGGGRGGRSNIRGFFGNTPAAKRGRGRR
ncbi:hypothetical protein ACHAXS_006748 [Conticribra weissflogii]